MPELTEKQMTKLRSIHLNATSQEVQERFRHDPEYIGLLVNSKLNYILRRATLKEAIAFLNGEQLFMTREKDGANGLLTMTFFSTGEEEDKIGREAEAIMRDRRR